MQPEMSEWHYARCKGKIAAFVARGKEHPDRIVKSIRTTMAKGNLDGEALERMLTEVESESVTPFLGPPWNQPTRLERFWFIKKRFQNFGGSHI